MVIPELSVENNSTEITQILRIVTTSHFLPTTILILLPMLKQLFIGTKLYI